MKYTSLKHTGLLTGTLIAALGLAIIPASALAGPALSDTTSDTTAGTSISPVDQKLVQLIITRGNNEITRRLTTLNKLRSTISSTPKLSASDKTALTNEVSSEASGLTNLKTTLDAETTPDAAKTDAQSIISGYRVYALIAPKVYLVKTADDQQVAEGKLTSLAARIRSDITADEAAGKDTAGLQAKLTDMTSKIQAAQTISSPIESSVIGLQPSDYNSNHQVLSGDRDGLKTAQSSITGAISDAKGLISLLKTL